MSDIKKALANEMSRVRLSPELKKRIINGGNDMKFRHKTYTWLAAAAALVLAVGTLALALNAGNEQFDRTTGKVLASADTTFLPTPMPTYEALPTPQTTAEPVYEALPTPQTTVEPIDAAETYAPKAIICDTLESRDTLDILWEGNSVSIDIREQYIEGALYVHHSVSGETREKADISEIGDMEMTSLGEEFDYGELSEGECLKICHVSFTLRDDNEDMGSEVSVYQRPPMRIDISTRYVACIGEEILYCDRKPASLYLVFVDGTVYGGEIPYFKMCVTPAENPAEETYESEYGKKLDAFVGKELTLIKCEEDWEDAADIAVYAEEGVYLFKTEDVFKDGAIVIGNVNYVN